MIPIPNYEGYFLDELGNVYGNRKHRPNMKGITKMLKQNNNLKGYPCVNLMRNGKAESKRVHRLIAETFIPNPLNKLQVNHKNGIKTDNRVVNLEWCTNKENRTHAKENNLIAKGETSGVSKLLEIEILKIRNDARSNSVIAKEYNIAPQTVSKIKLKRRWAHL